MKWAAQLGCDPNRSIEEVYDLKQTVGEGGFGTVHRAIHCETGIRRAVKVAPISRSRDVEALVHEVQMMRQVGDQKNVVQLIDTFVDNSAAYMVIEMCFGIDVFDWVDSLEGQQPPEDQVKHMLYDMVQGVHHCHKQGVLHQDVKLENFVFHSSDGSTRVKLIDFGLSEATDQLSSKIAGTHGYYAPEVEQGKKSIAGDVWSLGTTFFVMLSGGYIPRFTTKHDLTNSSLLALKVHSKEASDLCICMLNKDPEKRITLDAALGHAFFKGVSGGNGHVVNAQVLPTLDERAHVLFEAMLQAVSQRPVPETTCVLRGDAATQDSLVLSGNLKTRRGEKAGPGDLILARREFVAENDALLLSVEGRSTALKEARQRGRRYSYGSKQRPSSEEIRSAEKRLEVLSKVSRGVFSNSVPGKLLRLDRSDTLIKYGTMADEAYMILQGSLDVVDPKGVSVDELGPGHLVGEMAVILGAKRSADVVARTDVVVYPLSRQVMKELNEDKAQALWLRETADKRDFRQRIVKFLRTSPVFADSHLDLLYQIATVIQPKFVRSGEAIFNAGSVGEHLYVVQQGQATVEHAQVGLVDTLKPGAVFGEMALVFGAPRSATVIASSDCELLALSKADFDSVIKRFPGEKARLQQVANERRTDLLRRVREASSPS